MLQRLEGETAEVLGRISRQDLTVATTARLAHLVAMSEPGACLPSEKELCEQLGVGRSTVREAMRALAFIGAVHTRQGSGTFVGSPEDGSLERLIGICVMLQRSAVEEVIELRRVLEVEAARLAAMCHDDQDRQELASVMESMAASAADPAVASRFDVQFHTRLARASHNSLLRSFTAGMRSMVEVWVEKAVNREPVVEEIVKEHNAILRAVIDRNPERAAAFMTAHLSNAAERLFAVVGKDQSTASYFSLLLSGGGGR